MSTPKYSMTLFQLSLGLSVSAMSVITAGLGIRMYAMAKSFVSDDAACTAHGIASFLHLVMALSIVSIAFFSYCLGAGKVLNAASKVEKSSQLMSVRSMLVSGSTIIGLLTAVLIGTMSGLSYFGIYMNVSEWKDLSTVCSTMNSAFSPENVADGISITLVIMFSLACLALITFIAYPFVMARRSKTA